MEAALFGLAVLACPLGMVAMIGGMMWMGHRAGSQTQSAAEPGDADVREVSHA